MSGMGNSLENSLLNNVFRNVNFGPPANVFVSLHSADPGETGASEIAFASYARVSVSTTGGWTDPTAGSQGEVDNIAAVTFPTAGESWGTITHVGLFDALTVGNFLWGGALDSAKTIDSGDTLKFAIGELNFQLD